MNHEPLHLKETLLDCVKIGSTTLLEYFGRNPNVRSKGHQSNIVTDADLASERAIVELIQSRFPAHRIVAEETGDTRRDSEFTWVIDPLDGTSNFAAGLPWFGVQVALLQRGDPLLAAMQIPVTNTLYVSEKGRGAHRDETRVQVTPATDLRDVLCAYGIDAYGDTLDVPRQAEMLQRVVNGVRNVRATNCLLDFAYTIDGRLGGCINHNAKIWDIAPLALLLPEAGGLLTDLQGHPIAFRLDTEPFDRNYTVCGASRILHPKLLGLVLGG